MKLSRSLNMFMPSIGLTSVLVFACTSSEPPPPSAQPADEKPKSVITKYESAVAPGKYLACSDLIDMAAFSTQLGEGQVGEIKDKTTKPGENTSVCAIHRAGTPPSEKEQERMYKNNFMQLGVLPGDEWCTVTLSCNFPAIADDFKKKCESQGMTDNRDLGQFACVRTMQRGTKSAYTYKIIDEDTQCFIEVKGGPSVTNEKLVQSCTLAARDSATKAKLSMAQ